MWGHKTRSNAFGILGVVLLTLGVAQRFNWVSVDIPPTFYIVLGAAMLVHGALVLAEQRRDASHD